MFGENKEEHDRRLIQVLKRLESANITLNSRKCEFSKTAVKFFYIIDRTGVKAKTDAICKMESPKSVPDLRRFLGMVNQMANSRPTLRS